MLQISVTRVRVGEAVVIARPILGDICQRKLRLDLCKPHFL